jgi:arsenite methyltransferase
MTITVDTSELEEKVQRMYRAVATEPRGAYHFELGRSLAERLGYPAEVLDVLPEGAIESFAGVGYFFDLADLRPGESVVDLGSGSGMDVFFACTRVGPQGRVLGVDFTVEQLSKARTLTQTPGFDQAEFRAGRIERLPADDETVDCVISNGVINLSPEKEAVFAEAARVLRPGGRLAIADIVSERQFTDSIVCDADLWASCIAGAAQEDTYLQAIEAAGLRVMDMRRNTYEFISPRARRASAKYGVKSISLLAWKERYTS